jgi:hypothetical protein
MTEPTTRQILEYVRAQILLETGLTDDQVHFLTSIDTPVENLPDVVVFSLLDKPTREEGTDSDGSQEHQYSFGVTVSVKSEDEKDTDLLACQVRKAVLQDVTLGRLAFGTVWDGQEWGSGNASAPTAMTKLTFTATYQWSQEW